MTRPDQHFRWRRAVFPGSFLCVLATGSILGQPPETQLLNGTVGQPRTLPALTDESRADLLQAGLSSALPCSGPSGCVGSSAVVLASVLLSRALPAEDAAWIAGAAAATTWAAIVALLAGVCAMILTMSDRRLADWAKER